MWFYFKSTVKRSVTYSQSFPGGKINPGFTPGDSEQAQPHV